MRYTAMLLDCAEHDLRNIHAHVEIQFSEKLANKIYTDIRDAILSLEDNPNLGHRISRLSELGITDYRYLVVEKRNKVVYQMDTGKKRIYIYLICNERQDFETAFAKRMLEM